MSQHTNKLPFIVKAMRSVSSHNKLTLRLGHNKRIEFSQIDTPQGRVLGYQPESADEVEAIFKSTMSPSCRTRLSVVPIWSNTSEPELLKYNGLSKDDLMGLCEEVGIKTLDSDTVSSMKRLLDAYNLGMTDG
tara:strand:- start:244 stop:642 length:399 start_codon:yes stop_codon:yes gene_type:complete